VHVSQSGDVSAGPRKARYQTALDRIVAHDHDSRDGRGCPLDDRGKIAAKRKDHFRIVANQLIGLDDEALRISLSVAILNCDSFAVDIAQRFQALQQMDG
jgi:hypothetical protein